MRRDWIMVGLVVLCGGLSKLATAQDDPKTKPAPPPQKNTTGEPGKPPPIKPGKDRWAVKTGTDKDAEKVELAPHDSTIEKLLALPRPSEMPLDGSNPIFQDHRASPVETSVFTVEADIVSAQLMPDGDYKVTLRGASGDTLVMEMPNPDPEFVDPKSRFAAKIKSARSQFDTKLHPERTAKPFSGHVRITGLGFWGRNYNKTKPPTGNLIQLHPILNVEWLDKPTPAFSADVPKTQPAKEPPSGKSTP